MTSNQINLGRLREDIRHHGQEERLGFATLGETSRHNKRQEAIGFGNISLGYSTLGETRRHNISQEGYQGELALSQAGLAQANTSKTLLDVTHYLDRLKVEQDKAQAALSQAETAAQRAEIEQQLADIKEEMKSWEKAAIALEGARDVSTALFGRSGVVGGIQSIIGSNANGSSTPATSSTGK